MWQNSSHYTVYMLRATQTIFPLTILTKQKLISFFPFSSRSSFTLLFTIAGFSSSSSVRLAQNAPKSYLYAMHTIFVRFVWPEFFFSTPHASWLLRDFVCRCNVCMLCMCLWTKSFSFCMCYYGRNVCCCGSDKHCAALSRTHRGTHDSSFQRVGTKHANTTNRIFDWEWKKNAKKSV